MTVSMERIVDQRLRSIYQCLRYDLHEKALQQIEDVFYSVQKGASMQDPLWLAMVQGLAAALHSLHAREPHQTHNHIRNLHYKLLESMLDQQYGYS